MATWPQGSPQWLGPSDHLMSMFRTCSRDPAQAIKARLKRMLNMFLFHHGDSLEPAATCCRQAEVWYYRILEKLVSQERKRLGITDLSGILKADLWQRCLVTCCLQISICLNHLPCDLPRVLRILQMAPYHFWRVIGLVLRAEAGLSRDVITHLSQVEEEVLESWAWTSDSLLWQEIRSNRGHLPTCQQVMPPGQSEDPAAVNRPQRSSPLHLFARKVYGLMKRRLRELCSTLDVSDELRLKIWRCFEHSLVFCSHLMVDRHLDQLLMCAIYMTAKVTMVEIPFKHIMKCYKIQPHARKSVCSNVLISGRNVDNPHYPGAPQERGGLIDFYNQVYTADMEHFTQQLGAAPETGFKTCCGMLIQGDTSRRHQVLRGLSVYISPHNPESPSPSAPSLTYYFNTSPPERLREINNMIRTGRSPTRRRAPLIPEEGDDRPLARRPRLGDESAWQRRLRSVVNDREGRRSEQGGQNRN